LSAFFHINLTHLLTSEIIYITPFLADNYTDEAQFLEYERTIEGMYMMMLAITGVFLNALIFLCVCVFEPLRSYTNGFMIHACLLDAFKVRWTIKNSKLSVNIESIDLRVHATSDINPS